MTHEREPKTDPCGPPPAVLYLSVLEELEQARRNAGGRLPDETESAFVERLDDLWWELSSDEQDDINAQGLGLSD